MAQKKYPAPNKNQSAVIRARRLDPKYFTVMRELNYTLFLKDIRDGSVKIIDKKSSILWRIWRHSQAAQGKGL